MRDDFNFNKATVDLFEEYLQDNYPDDHWMLDKVYDEDGEWEYRVEYVESYFSMFLHTVAMFKGSYYNTESCEVVWK